MLGAALRNKTPSGKVRRRCRFRRALRRAQSASGTCFFKLWPVKLICGLLMALIAFGGEDKLWRCCLTFFAVSALFGGAVWAISLQNGGNFGSGAYIPVSLPVLILSFALIYAVLSFVFQRSVKSADACVSDVEIEFMGRRVFLRCLHDSGNALLDPVSGDSVLIAPAARLAPLFPGCEDELSSTDCTKAHIPAAAFGKKCGLYRTAPSEQSPACWLRSDRTPFTLTESSATM